MKQARRYDSYYVYVGGLSEKDAAAYVAKIKRKVLSYFRTFVQVSTFVLQQSTEVQYFVGITRV
jgi:hypothetical protein